MHRNQSVNVKQFAIAPAPGVPRSRFRIQKTYKTTFDAGYLIPFYVTEILPGDHWQLKATLFCRLSTPIVPVMDNMYIDTQFWFVPCRLLWTNWQKFMGEQVNPADSISYTIPQLVSPAGGFAVGSIMDYMGLPVVGNLTPGNTVSVNALPMRAYTATYNQWYRDENLQNSMSPALPAGDGPDTLSWYALQRRGKRHDYFTSCLPWTQKGGVSVSIPLGTSAPVKTQSTDTVTGAQAGLRMKDATGVQAGATNTVIGLGAASASANPVMAGANALTTPTGPIYPSNLYADLSAATAATVNQLRQSTQIQKLLEREARGGSRYTEIIKAHFNVTSLDARLNRPEYLGGGSSPVTFNPVTQNTQGGLTGGSTPMGTLASYATSVAHGHGFAQAFTEHGYILGICSVRADLTYSQGIRKMWSRLTKYDFYFPVFQALGEQAVLNREIYCKGDQDPNDALVFGYNERWAEYRYDPSLITGQFRSQVASPIDIWHLSQNFTSLPTLNATFIVETPPVSRILAVGAAANGQQFLLDAFFDVLATRPMPLYSVPGNMDRF